MGTAKVRRSRPQVTLIHPRELEAIAQVIPSGCPQLVPLPKEADLKTLGTESLSKYIVPSPRQLHQNPKKIDSGQTQGTSS